MSDKLSKNAINAYKKLYLNRNSDDKIIENIKECHNRVATFLGKTNNEKNEFVEILDKNIFRPNTPVFCNAGIDTDPLLSACFITGLEDSMQGIIELWANAATIFAGGGGIGIPLSNLREKGSPIKHGGIASGPISYLKVIESISETVKSGGKDRRAATITSFKYKHPDIMEYINCKADKKSFSSINISVLVDDEFMNHIINGCNDNCYTPVSPNINAKTHLDICYNDVWEEIIQQAWFSGDPGILFYDTINRWNPLPSLGDITCPNPCGEVIGPVYYCCNLGHINLNKILNPNGRINWAKFKKYIYTAVKFLNRVIDASAYPHPKFQEMMTKTRPIGLGLMGFHDILFKMKIPYDSQEACDLLSDITAYMTKWAFRVSIELAYNEQRHINIPRKDYKHFEGILMHYNVFDDDEYSDKYFNLFNKTGILNSTVTCLAPTGCQTGDTFVSTEEGLLTLNELNPNISKEQWQPLSLSVSAETNNDQSDQFFTNGLSPVYKIEGEFGGILNPTPEHRYRIYDLVSETIIWKHSAKLKQGDFLVKKFNDYSATKYQSLDNTMNQTFPNLLNEDLATLIGYYMADGHGITNVVTGQNIENKGSWRLDFTTNSETKQGCIDFIQKIIQQYFHVDVSVYPHDKNAIRTSSFSKDLIQWFIQNGLSKTGSLDAHIPRLIRQSPKSVVFAFLSGLYSGDGHIRSDRTQPYYKTSSTLLKTQLNVLLPSLGFLTRVTTDKIEGNKIFIVDHGATANSDSYLISFLNKTIGLSFLNKIKFLRTDMEETRQQYLTTVKTKSYQGDRIPVCFDVMPADIKKHISTKKSRGESLFISRQKLIQAGVSNEFIKNNWALEQITDIQLLKEPQMTYDLSIPKTNCYISNGVISHNTTAISADASYSFEPCFALAFGKNITDSDETWDFIDPTFKAYCENNGIPIETILPLIDLNHGSIKGLDEFFNKKEQAIFCVAHDINWDDRLKIQAAAQEHITMSISSTVNLPNSATREDVESVYKRAYTLGLKGITVYRDGCKADQPIQFSKPKEKNMLLDTEELQKKIEAAHVEALHINELWRKSFDHMIKRLHKSPKEVKKYIKMWSVPTGKNHFYNMYKNTQKDFKPKEWIITGVSEEQIAEITKEFELKPENVILLKPGEQIGFKPTIKLRGAIKRPMVREGKTVEVKTNHGKLYITGNYIDGTLAEVFISMGHQGSFNNTLLDTIGRLISKSLQHYVSLDILTDTMRGVGGEIQWIPIKDGENPKQMNGIIDIIATILDMHFSCFGPVKCDDPNADPIDPIDDIQTYSKHVINDNKVSEPVDLDGINPLNPLNSEEENIFDKSGFVGDHVSPSLKPGKPAKNLNEFLQYERCPECRKFTLSKSTGCRGGRCLNPTCSYSCCS